MSHLPVSQRVAEPGMEETVKGCHPVAESKSGQGLKGQKRGGMGQCGLMQVRDPVKKCFPHLCLHQEPGRGPAPAHQVQGDAENPTRLGWNLLWTKVQATWSSVQSPRG